MPAPSVRYKILPARGDKTALDAAIAAIDEGEICYARDEDRFYVKESGVLVLTSMEEAPNDGTQYVRRNEAWEAVDVPPGTVVSNVAPVTPDNGQLWYDTEDARIFVWTGTEWADASPDAGNPTVITSDSAPGAPQDGDLWFRTSDGRMYVYYDDGASSQWVDANPATGASNWNYDGTTLTPGTTGTDVDLGTGDLSAAAGTFSGDVLAGTDSAVNIPGCKLDKTGAVFSLRSAGSTSPIFQGGVVGAGTNIQLNANGTADFYYPTNSNATFMRWYTDIGGTKTEKIRFVTNGDAFKPGGGSWGAISDARSKTVVSPYQSSLAELKQVEPVLYKYNGLDKEYVGVVAQQVETVMPELVSVSPGTTYDGTEIEDLRSVDQTPLTFALINAVKEMATRIEALESANAALEARLSILEGN